MFEDFFATVNAYLLSHPHAMETLRILFWVKYWLLTILMGYFVYLIYKEKPQRLPAAYGRSREATFLA